MRPSKHPSTKSDRPRPAPITAPRPAAVQDEPRRWIARYVMPAVIAALAFVCFLPALGNDFVYWDDDRTFTDNPYYRGLSLVHLKWMLTTTLVGQYRPLTWLTYAIDYTFWGMNPVGYHLSSMLLHAANAVLLYLFIAAFLRSWQTASDGNTLQVSVAATVGALFFAIHPLRVEAVAWATERQDVLCGFFFLLTLLAYLRMLHDKRHGDGTGRRWLFLSTVSFALSLLAKPAGLMLPLALLILDVYPFRRLSRTAGTLETPAAVLIEKIPYAALSLGATALAVMAKHPEAMMTLRDHGLPQRVVQAAFGLCFYLWKTVVPFWLSPLYLLRTPLDVTEPQYLVSVLAVTGITVAVIVLRRGYPWALVAWACYVVILFPVLGLVQNGAQIAADRYTYLGCLPWAVLVAAGVYQLRRAGAAGRLVQSAQYAISALILAALGFLGVRSVQQTAVWRNTVTLWTHALAIDPTNYVAYNNRGGARQLAGDLPDALADLNHALSLSPGHVQTYSNRGNLRQALGDVAGALTDFNFVLNNRRSIDRYTLSDTYTNRGKIRQSTGDIDGALADYNDALRLNPDHSKAFNNRGVARQAKGDLDGAVADFTQAIRLNPDYANAYNNRGNARQAKGDFGGALGDFDQAVRLDPRDASAYFNRGNARKTKGDLAAAIADYSAALRGDPQYATAYNNRGNARRLQGDLDGALADFSDALRLNPQYANAYNNRGIVRQAKGDLDGAVADYEQAVQLAAGNGQNRATFERNLAAARDLAARTRAVP